MWNHKHSALAYCTTRPLLAEHNKYYLIINFLASGHLSLVIETGQHYHLSLSSHHNHPTMTTTERLAKPQTGKFLFCFFFFSFLLIILLLTGATEADSWGSRREPQVCFDVFLCVFILYWCVFSSRSPFSPKNQPEPWWKQVQMMTDTSFGP